MTKKRLFARWMKLRMMNIINSASAIIVAALIPVIVMGQNVQLGDGGIHISAEQAFGFALSALGLYLLTLGRVSIKHNRSIDRVLFILEGEKGEQNGVMHDVAALKEVIRAVKGEAINAANNAVQERLSSFDERLLQLHDRMDRALERKPGNRNMDDTDEYEVPKT